MNVPIVQEYLELSQKSGFFSQILFSPKNPIADVRLGSKYAPVQRVGTSWFRLIHL